MKSALSQLGRRTDAPAISWLMALTLGRPKLISLAAGFTDNESLPLDMVRGALEEILQSPKTGLPALQYGTTAGDSTLRDLTAEWVRGEDRGRDRKVYSSERVVITSGSQQLLYMTAEALCDAGDIVLLEDPTYFVYLGIMQSHGLRARGIPLQQDGIDLARLEATLEDLKRSGELPRVKMLYLVTYFQNPTGTTTSFEKKLAALKLLRRYERAAGHPIYLLEDAAYRELRFGDEDVPSALAANGFADRIIYAGTYSKPFATGARVGFGFLPPQLREIVLRIKGNHDFGSANLLQQLLARVLASGQLESHLRDLRLRYACKAQVMTKAARQHFPAEVRWAEPQGGLYVWARLPASLKSGVKSKLFKAALDHEVLYVPGELCYAQDPTRKRPNHEMRLSFGGASERNITEGIKRLGQTFHEFLDK